MAHSYKKNPVYKDYNRGAKTVANKNVRRKLKHNHENISKGNIYRKMYNSWNISDYRFRLTLDDEIKRYKEEMFNGDKYNIKKTFPDEYAIIKWWKKIYLYK